MLSVAEHVQISLLFWHGTIGDLNPVIASAFPVLAVAYTGMSDRIGDERKAAQAVEVVQTSTIKAEDIDQALKALAEVKTLREQIAQLQSVQVQPIAPMAQQIPAQSATLADDQAALPTNEPAKPERGLPFASFEKPITALYRDNPSITVPEIMQTCWVFAPNG